MLSALALGGLSFVYNASRTYFDAERARQLGATDLVTEINSRARLAQRKLREQVPTRTQDYFDAVNAQLKQNPLLFDVVPDVSQSIARRANPHPVDAEAAKLKEPNLAVDVPATTGNTIGDALAVLGSPGAPPHTITFPKYRDVPMRALLIELERLSDDSHARNAAAVRHNIVDRLESLVELQRSSTSWTFEKRSRYDVWRLLALLGFPDAIPAVAPAGDALSAVPFAEETKRLSAEALKEVEGESRALHEELRK